MRKKLPAESKVRRLSRSSIAAPKFSQKSLSLFYCCEKDERHPESRVDYAETLHYNLILLKQIEYRTDEEALQLKL